MRYSEVVRRLRQHGAYFVREGAGHEVWRCNCGAHQTAVPRHQVSAYVVGKISKQLACIPKEWWQ
jgi:hypothetical protein